MPFTTPATWVAGDVLTAAQLNTQLRDNVSFLANPPACRVHHNAVQSIAHNVQATVLFNSERYDTDTMHDNVTNNSRITFTTGGLYVVTLSMTLDTFSDYTLIMAGIRLGGATLIAQQNIGTNAQVDENINISLATIYKFAAGNYIEARVRHRNGASAARNLQSAANFSPEFAATWIGLG